MATKTATDWFNGEDDQVVLDQALTGELEEAFAAVEKVGTSAEPPPAPEYLDNVVRLPRGVFVGSTYQTAATVRELTGADEESLAKVRDEAAAFDHILALGVESIGSIDFSSKPVSERKAILGKLLVAEQWLLFFGIARVTFGDTKEYKFTCAKCDTEHETTVVISEDFPIHYPEGVDLGELATFKTKKGSVISFRPTTGLDVGDLLEKKGVTQAEVTSKLLTRLIVEVDGKPPLDPEVFVKTMSMRDRSNLVTAIANNQPSVDLTLTIPCSGCGEEVILPFTWRDLFRP